jgi:HEPN domain-containing protein
MSLDWHRRAEDLANKALDAANRGDREEAAFCAQLASMCAQQSNFYNQFAIEHKISELISAMYRTYR